MNKIKDNYEVGDVITPSVINEAFSTVNALIDAQSEMASAIETLTRQIETLTRSIETLSSTVLTKDEFNTVLSDAADAYFPVQ